MFKVLFVILILAGAFFYFRLSRGNPKISYPQFPQSLSQINLESMKDWSSGLIDRYFPDTASQTAVLGAKAKNESLILVVEAAKKLKPDEFKALQQFVCEQQYSTPKPLP